MLTWAVICADTTYTVSGARDHYKQQGQAGLVLQQVPEHANFFSGLSHYPKSTFRCDTPLCVQRASSSCQPSCVVHNIELKKILPTLTQGQGEL